jgi:surface polysaccharide O-acyltransferase-like enzyme
MKNNTSTAKGRILYVENLRVLLSFMVVAVHAASTYGAPGGWTYSEKGADLLTLLPLTIFNATSQSFFMGLFFFIGAYFTHLSFQRKGLWKFIKDRFLRLGIPLLLTVYLISPLCWYLVWPIRHPDAEPISFVDLWLGGRAFGVGVMWFAEALIYFTLLYLFIYAVSPFLKERDRKQSRPIYTKHIFYFTLALAAVTFFVRTVFPLFHRNLHIHFELGHFPQYILLFVLGVLAARYKSDNFITCQEGKKWGWMVSFLVILIFPLMFFLGGAQSHGVSLFLGGWTWQSLAFSFWEQFTGIAMMVFLLGVLRTKWNHQNRITSSLSSCAYGVYVFHPPILIGISLLFKSWEAMHLVKFLVVAPLAFVLSYGFTLLIKQLPFMKTVF